MKTLAVSILLLTAASGAAWAEEERRSESAHVHGVSRLDIAIEGESITMGLTAPAADILGFEHEARSAEEKKALAEASAKLAKLAKPMSLFALNKEANCAAKEVVVGEQAELDGGHEHEHEHDEHSHDEHAHEKHAHDEHKHDEHEHDEHDHHEHAHHGDHETEQHSDLHARYVLACANSGALRTLAFPYFDAFPNAEKIELRLITKKGQFANTVPRGAPPLDLSGAQ